MVAASIPIDLVLAVLKFLKFGFVLRSASLSGSAEWPAAPIAFGGYRGLCG
jgi:hypothetical protein